MGTTLNDVTVAHRGDLVAARKRILHHASLDGPDHALVLLKSTMILSSWISFTMAYKGSHEHE